MLFIAHTCTHPTPQYLSVSTPLCLSVLTKMGLAVNFIPSKVLGITGVTNIVPFIVTTLLFISCCHLRKVWAPVSKIR